MTAMNRPMKRRWRLLGLSVLASALTWVSAAPAAPNFQGAAGEIEEELAASGWARVSVLFKHLGSDEAATQAQDDIEAALLGEGSFVLHRFQFVDGMSIVMTTEAELQSLADHPSVESFSLSGSGTGMLDFSREKVGANVSFEAGYTGAGRVVAVIDSGIESSHDSFGGRVIDEACFCPGCCPLGGNTEFGPGAAADDHGHGTGVSSIIGGEDGGAAPRGDAPGVQFVAVKVLDEFNRFDSLDDVTAAMEWVGVNHPEVDVINLSLGTGDEHYGANCDTLSGTPADVVMLGNVISTLRAAGIVTVAAGGNSGDKVFVPAPACITDVITVGWADRHDTLPPELQVPFPFDSADSNEAIDLWAPGWHQVVAYLANGAGHRNMSSFAAPHVSAAVALLHEAAPSLSTEALLECLVISNTQLTDAGNGITRPFLDIPAAMEACGVSLCNEGSYEAETMDHSTGNAVAGGWNIYDNGFIATTHGFTAGTARITVRALGQPAQGVWPHMVVSVDGMVVGDAFVTSPSYADYPFTFPVTGGEQEIRVAFDNDVFNPPFEDRNLFVDRVQIGCDSPGGSPCAGLCAEPTSISWSGAYQGQQIGAEALCLETDQAVVGANCGEFAPGRMMSINGAEVPCNQGNWNVIAPERNGGYCVEVTAGDNWYAYLTLW